MPTIEPNEVRELLIAACPDLSIPFSDNDEDEVRAGLPYLEMATVAGFLGERLRTLDTDMFPAFFGAVEECLLEGAEATEELVMVGLLEDLQNSNITGVADNRAWLPYLPPVTAGAWRAVAAFWEGDVDAINDYVIKKRNAPPTVSAE